MRNRAIRRIGRTVATVLAVGLVAVPSAFAQYCQNNPANFPAWLNGVRSEALAAGISPNAVAALNGVTYDQSIINRDRSQSVFSPSE